MDVSDFLAPVDDNFLCTICQSVMVSPSACSQGHQFCRECISKWLQKSSTCPQRCGKLVISNLTKLRGAENLINKFQVRCRHSRVSEGPSPGPKNLRRRSRAKAAPGDGGSDAGCGWVGSVENRAKHLRDECAYSVVKCGCEGCGAKVLRSQLAEHKASCVHREVRCEKCDQTVKAGEVSDHALGCARLEIECPHACGARVLRCDLAEHEKEFENAVVSCSCAAHGCSFRGKGKKMAEHEEEAAAAHARLAGKRAEALEQELSELKAQRASRGRGASGGAAKVTWRIAGFTAKAQKKEQLLSNVFHVQTPAGTYHLHLSLAFAREAGSTRHGYAGVFVRHDFAHGGSADFPINLSGTVLTVQKGRAKARELFSEQRAPLLTGNDKAGNRKMMRVDKIRGGIRWTRSDVEADESDWEPEEEAADLLEDDTLTVKGYVCLSPPMPGPEIEI